MRRFICRMFSCDYDGYEACRRCGEWIYGGEFIEMGRLSAIVWFVGRTYQRFRKWTGHWRKCDTCGKRGSGRITSIAAPKRAKETGARSE